MNERRRYDAYVDGRQCHNCGLEPYRHECPIEAEAARLGAVIQCPTCRGMGDCPTCDGSGRVDQEAALRAGGSLDDEAKDPATPPESR